MNTLQGRTVVLTGASGGIGGALAAALVDAGATVLAVGRDPAKLNALVHRLRPGAVVPVAADLGTPEGRAAVAGRAAAMAPSMLVMAHAQSSFGLFQEQSEGELATLLQTNLVSSMLLVRAMLPLLSRGPQASVVAVGSTFGALGFPGFAAYSASKFGLRGLMEALAREHAGGKVRFQYLSPRATRTAFNTPAVDALNAELRTAQDEPSEVAAQLLRAIVRGDRRRQLGWPEKFFVRLNGLLPALVDRALLPQLPVVRRHASHANPNTKEKLHEAHAN